MTIQKIDGFKLLNFASHIDDNTIEQAKQTASMPFVHPHVALMPDAHSGKGSAVGTVIPTIDAVIPAAVGVDIGCGMIAVKTRHTEDDLIFDLGQLRESIEAVIPLSPGNYNHDLDRFPFTGARIEALQNLAWPGDDGQDLTHRNVDLSHSPKWREQLGSLGGGNHFIELCIDEQQRVWLFLHSGSRGVGNKIAQKHIKIAQQLCKRWWIDLPNPDLAYLPQGTPEFATYLRELNWAQRFALENRAEMMDRYVQVFAHWLGVESECVEVDRINCFAGETRVITRTGVRPIDSLAGGLHELLTDGGEWIKAPVKHFGRQEVVDVTLMRSGVTKTIRATPDHRWLLLTRRGRKYEATTEELCAGDRMQLAFARRPEGMVVDRLAAARGFVYGDGTLPKGRTKSIAYFCGDKDKALLPLFEGLGNPPRTYDTVIRVGGLPGEWKSERPPLDSTPSTLYGWLAGYFAADGDVDKTGRPTLASSSCENLEYVRTVCQAIGIGTFGIRIRTSVTPYSHGRSVAFYLVGLMREDLSSDFFLIPEHRQRFESRKAAGRRYWRVQSVRRTGEYSDVYCAAVDGTHSFALEDNILTGNCHHNYTVKEKHGGKNVWLTRKGAVNAHEGVMGIIPGSMGTHSYIVRGKGNQAGLCSAPHGAGRRFSRTEARRRFTADDLADRMKGIEYRHGDEWVDEIPDAYKDVDQVIADAADLVEVEHTLRQVLNVKGT